MSISANIGVLLASSHRGNFKIGPTFTGPILLLSKERSASWIDAFKTNGVCHLQRFDRQHRQAGCYIYKSGAIVITNYQAKRRSELPVAIVNLVACR